MRAVVDAPVKRTWGGKRAGAGRKRDDPKMKRRRVEHGVRTVHRNRFPVHVTVRAAKGLPSFRAESIAKIFKSVLRDQRRNRPKRKYRDDFQVVHFSVQTNHLHLIVEANGDHLRSGVSGLVIAFAKRLNRLLRRAGKVWDDRYHARDLATPSDVRNVMSYVFQNYKKHGYRTFGYGVTDPLSSASAFDGWSIPIGSPA
jgi:putative transposase